MAEVQLVDVEKRYGAFLAVPKQSLTIEEGEFLVLLGPSGCGKTTTMRMIAGLEEITSGDLMIAGERANDKPPKDRDIAMVFQNYGLYPHMTVGENIGYPLKLRGMDRKARETRVQETAEKVELQALLKRRPSELSGGQRQRIAIARAAILGAAVLVFDDSTAAIDAGVVAIKSNNRFHFISLFGMEWVNPAKEQGMDGNGGAMIFAASAFIA